MFLLGAFEAFDPYSEQIPDEPFKDLPEIVDRAISVLRSEWGESASRETLAATAVAVDELITSYFVTEAEISHGELAHDGGVLRFGAINPENTSLLGALKEMVYLSDDMDIDRLGKAPPCTLFATLCLYHVEEAIDHLSFLGDRSPQPENDQSQNAGRPVVWYVIQAANHVVCAMEAVCESEGSAYGQWVEEERSIELGELEARIENLSHETSESAHRLAKKLISERARRGASAAHRENRAMKAQVFEWCEAELVNHPSIDAAAAAIAGKLVPVTFRTVQGWISQYRRNSLQADRKS